MNDIIKPFDFDLTKKLHGHVRVETRSRWTGRVVDSQEKDNLVTNAVQMMLQTQAWYNLATGMATVSIPIWKRALGGLMLFDNTLTEQASNVHFPASAKLVGYAGQGAHADDGLVGSCNLSESTMISNGYTTVWDFLTSQANGTIASLSRTTASIENSLLMGNASFDLRLNGLGTSTNVYYLGYNEANKYVYLALTTNQTYNGVTYSTNTIYRVKCNLYAFDMTWNMVPTLDNWEAVKTLTSSDGSTTARYFAYDKWANNFVYNYNSTTIHIVAMDGTHTTKTITGASGANGFAVSENYYWTLSPTTLYRIDKTNTANIKSYAITAYYIAAGENDILYARESSAQNTNMRIIYPDDTIIATPTMASLTIQEPRILGPFYCYGQRTSNAQSTAWTLYHRTNYLGTIANLDSPVTKTSSQTMKITYTLTEA